MGRAVRRIRLAKKLSRAELADLAGLSREYINKIEAGKYDPPLSTINAIAEALE